MGEVKTSDTSAVFKAISNDKINCKSDCKTRPNNLFIDGVESFAIMTVQFVTLEEAKVFATAVQIPSSTPGVSSFTGAEIITVDV